MPKRIVVGKDWKLITDYYTGIPLDSSFIGQVSKGMVMIASSTSLPTTNDYFTFRSKALGGFSDEWFEVGETGKKAYIKAATEDGTCEVVVEVKV